MEEPIISWIKRLCGPTEATDMTSYWDAKTHLKDLYSSSISISAQSEKKITIFFLIQIIHYKYVFFHYFTWNLCRTVNVQYQSTSSSANIPDSPTSLPLRHCTGHIRWRAPAYSAGGFDRPNRQTNWWGNVTGRSVLIQGRFKLKSKDSKEGRWQFIYEFR